MEIKKDENNNNNNKNSGKAKLQFQFQEKQIFQKKIRVNSINSGVHA